MANSRPKAKDLVDVDSTGVALSDYLGMGGMVLPFVNQAARARYGRADAMARAAGMDPGYLLQHPQTTQAGGVLAGAGLGALATAGTLSALRHAGVGGTLPSDKPLGVENAVLPIAGAAVGATAAGLLMALLRRRRMRQINKEFDSVKTLNPQVEETPDTVEAFFSPFSGVHRQAKARTNRKLLGKDEGEDVRDFTGTSIAGGISDVVAPILPPAGLVGAIASGYAGNVDANEINNRLRNVHNKA